MTRFSGRLLVLVILAAICTALCACASADDFERQATGDLHLDNNNGLWIRMDPQSHVLSSGQSISVWTEYTGDYGRTMEDITGFTLTLNGNLYRSYSSNSFSCVIPSGSCLNYITSKKVTLEIDIHARSGSGYFKDTFYLDPAEDWACGHEYVYRYTDASRSGWQLVCRICGKIGASSYNPAEDEDDALRLVSYEVPALAQQVKTAGGFTPLTEDEAYDLLKFVYGKSMSTWFFGTRPRDEVKDYFSMLTGKDGSSDADKTKRSFLFTARTLLQARSGVNRSQLNARIERLKGYVNESDLEGRSSPYKEIGTEKREYNQWDFVEDALLYGLDEEDGWEAMKTIYKASTGKDKLRYTIVGNDTLWLTDGKTKTLVGSLTQDPENREMLEYLGYTFDETGWYKETITGYTDAHGNPIRKTERVSYSATSSKSGGYDIEDADFTESLFALTLMDADLWEASMNAVSTISGLASSNEARIVLEEWEILENQSGGTAGRIPVDHNIANMMKDASKAGGSQLKNPGTREKDLDKFAQTLFDIEQSLN